MGEDGDSFNCRSQRAVLAMRSLAIRAAVPIDIMLTDEKHVRIAAPERRQSAQRDLLRAARHI